MKVRETDLEDVLLVEPCVYRDARGFFLETYQLDRYTKAGISAQFVQDNFSRSGKGVLRGLHFQLRHPQGKLVRVSRGRIFDVAVDIRRGSPSFGKWLGVELSEDNQHQLYIPAGFAHGFCVLSDLADVHYKCTDYYRFEDEEGLLWSDPALAIDWPIGEPLVSDKDNGYGLLNMHADDRLPIYRG